MAKAIHAMIRVLDEARDQARVIVANAHGDGYGHIAFVVDDLDAEHARFTREALQPNPVKEFHRDNTLLAKFFFVSDPDGYRIEVLQKHGRYR